MTQNPAEVYKSYKAAKLALEVATHQIIEMRKDLKELITDVIDNPDPGRHDSFAFLPRSNQFDLGEGQIVTIHSRVPNDQLPSDQAGKVKAAIIDAGWTIIQEDVTPARWSFVARQNVN